MRARLTSRQTSGLAVVGVVVGFIALLLWRAERIPDPQRPYPKGLLLEIDDDVLGRQLSEAVALDTSSHGGKNTVRDEALGALAKLLSREFPNAHRELKHERVGRHSLLYYWWGSEPELGALVLLANLDVAAVSADERKTWRHDPFSGAIADGAVWGRGAQGGKASAVAMLSGIEAAIEARYSPRRTVVLAFGHDAHAGGEHGAFEIAALLAKRNLPIALVVGGETAIVDGVVDGVDDPIAFVGISEKAPVTLELKATGPGASRAALAEAVAALEATPAPAQLSPPVELELRFLGARMPRGDRIVIGNLWLTRPFLGAWIAREDHARVGSTLRVLSDVARPGIDPDRSTAVVRYDVAPPDTAFEVVRHVERTLAEKPVSIRVVAGEKAKPTVASVDSPAFALLRKTIMETFTAVHVAPTLAREPSDLRHFAPLTHERYHFRPVRRDGSRDAPTVDEHIDTRNLREMAQFYSLLIRRFSATD